MATHFLYFVAYHLHYQSCFQNNYSSHSTSYSLSIMKYILEPLAFLSKSSNAVADINIALDLLNLRKPSHAHKCVLSTGLKSNPQHFQPIKCSYGVTENIRRILARGSELPSRPYKVTCMSDKLSNRTISFRFQTMHICKTCLWDHKVCDTDWRQYIIILNLVVIHLYITFNRQTLLNITLVAGG